MRPISQIQHPDQAGPARHLDPGQLLDRQAPGVFLVHRRDIVEPVEIGQVLQIGAAFHQLLGAAMQEPDMRVAAFDDLAVEFQHKPQDAMRRRVLRAEVDVEVADRLVVGQASSAVGAAIHHACPIRGQRGAGHGPEHLGDQLPFAAEPKEAEVILEPAGRDIDPQMHPRDLTARDIEAEDFVGRIARERVAPGDPGDEGRLVPVHRPARTIDRRHQEAVVAHVLEHGGPGVVQGNAVFLGQGVDCLFVGGLAAIHHRAPSVFSSPGRM
jgi:hypothetical protein